MTKKLPHYRFQGYTDAWELRKLGEVSKKISEKNVDNLYSETFTNSAEHGIISQRDFFDKDISNATNLNTYYIVRNNDFVYNPRISNYAPVGPVKRNKLGRTGVMSPLYYVFRTHDIDEGYLETYFDTTYWHSFMKLNGDSGARADRFAIKDSVFAEMPLPIPSLPEQEAIGTFFSTLDRHITLHQRKLDTLKEQKKTYLKLLFPAKGQTKPALRFQGFEDDWKEVKLGEVVNIQKGTQRGKQEISEIQSEQFPYPVYNGGQNVSGYTDEYNRENMVIVSEGGASAGYVNYYSGKFWSGGHNFSIDNLDNNLLFIKSILEFNQQKLYELKVGSGLPNVQLGTINQFVLSLPSHPEQEAIGTFFQTLDQETAQVEDKLASLKEMKKTLLRKLFV